MNRKVKIILNGIMRDEQENMENCIGSVKHLVDAISFDDTGSLDKTIEVTEAYIKKHKIPGKIWREKWEGFQQSRTTSLQHALIVAQELDPGAVWYAFFMDADNINYGTFDKKLLTHDCYNLEQRSGDDPFVNPMIYPFILLVQLNPAKPWTYFGPTRIHETITPPQGVEITTGDLVMQFKDPKTGKVTDAPGFVHSRRSGYRSKHPYTWISDLSDCLKDIKDNPENSRAWFYAGISCEGGSMVKMATYYYKMRTTFKDSFMDEKYVACLKIGRYYTAIDKTEKALHWFKYGINFNTKRLEIPYEIVKIYRKRGQYGTGWTEAKSCLGAKLAPYLFTEKTIFTFNFYDEAAICAYYSDEPTFAKNLFVKALSSEDADIINKSRIEENIRLCELQKSKLLVEGDVVEQLTLPEKLNTTNIIPIIDRLYKDENWKKCVEVCKDIDWKALPATQLIYYGVALFWVGEKSKSFTVNNWVSDRCKCNAATYGLSISNNTFGVEEVKNCLLYNPPPITHRKIANPKITLLFKGSEEMLKTFINACEDLYLIDQWVTENSEIKTKYPQFCSDIVKGKYILLLEGNYKFFTKKNYLEHLISVIESDSQIFSVALNKNYVTSYKDIAGGTEKWTKLGYRYIENNLEYKQFPGLFRKETLGKWNGSGILAFLPTINIL